MFTCFLIAVAISVSASSSALGADGREGSVSTVMRKIKNGEITKEYLENLKQQMEAAQASGDSDKLAQLEALFKKDVLGIKSANTMRLQTADKVVDGGALTIGSAITGTTLTGGSDFTAYTYFKYGSARIGKSLSVAITLTAGTATDCKSEFYVVAHGKTPDSSSNVDWKTKVPSCLLEAMPATSNLYLVLQAQKATPCTFSYTVTSKDETCVKVAIGATDFDKTFSVASMGWAQVTYTSTETKGKTKELDYSTTDSDLEIIATYAGLDYFSTYSPTELIAVVPNFKAVWLLYNAGAATQNATFNVTNKADYICHDGTKDNVSDHEFCLEALKYHYVNTGPEAFEGLYSLAAILYGLISKNCQKAATVQVCTKLYPPCNSATNLAQKTCLTKFCDVWKGCYPGDGWTCADEEQPTWMGLSDSNGVVTTAPILVTDCTGSDVIALKGDPGNPNSSPRAAQVTFVGLAILQLLVVSILSFLK
eukprot:gb/GEZN01005761.1/.p1 GENE.gb/GEZN01005761.1/~~gb/GEZN01005761.1/.p1  ORF type:complete len:480 (-),score=56.31 gb/GEZN01005761.1/:297-1736(-)